jgi:hypothetical protein
MMPTETNQVDQFEFRLSSTPMEIVESVPDPEDEVSLLDLLDKMLSKGVIVSGDLTISVAGIDLLYVGLRLMISTAEKAAQVGAVRMIGGKLL